jgi:hypothetical protein
MNYKYFNADGAEWAVAFYPGLLGIQKNGEKKWIRVEEGAGFRYKLLKTKILADGGAESLFRFVSDNCQPKDLFYCNVKSLLSYAFDVMREAKT